MTQIYKIIARETWQGALANGRFSGATIDLTDGYIHFSTADQAEETAARHFVGKTNLLLIAFDADAMGEKLRWEESRGGALFPHLYDALDPATALWALPLPWNGTRHEFPIGWRG
jgi:uncharacterized protein (DUF952 family)